MCWGRRKGSKKMFINLTKAEVEETVEIVKRGGTDEE